MTVAAISLFADKLLVAALAFVSGWFACAAQHRCKSSREAGEEVLVEGMVGIPHACGFGVCIKGELGFYDWTAFEPVEGGASI